MPTNKEYSDKLQRSQASSAATGQHSSCTTLAAQQTDTNTSSWICAHREVIPEAARCNACYIYSMASVDIYYMFETAVREQVLTLSFQKLPEQRSPLITMNCIFRCKIYTQIWTSK
jgi:hypothetical protein